MHLFTCSGNLSVHLTGFQGIPSPPSFSGRLRRTKSICSTSLQLSAALLHPSPPGRFSRWEYCRNTGNTENMLCTKEFFSAMREFLAAKLMNIVPVVWGFRSRPIMWSSSNQLCLRKIFSLRIKAQGRNLAMATDSMIKWSRRWWVNSWTCASAKLTCKRCLLLYFDKPRDLGPLAPSPLVHVRPAKKGSFGQWFAPCWHESGLIWGSYKKWRTHEPIYRQAAPNGLLDVLIATTRTSEDMGSYAPTWVNSFQCYRCAMMCYKCDTYILHMCFTISIFGPPCVIS